MNVNKNENENENEEGDAVDEEKADGLLQEEAIKPSYLPYYAQYKGEVMGRYGGCHPSGDMFGSPVPSVEVAVVSYLKSFFLGQVPCLQDRDASPLNVMHEVTAAKNVMVVGELKQAWLNAGKEIKLHVRSGGEGHETEAQLLEKLEQEQTHAAKAEAMNTFLTEQVGQVEVSSDYISILLVSHFMWSSALESPDLLLSCSTAIRILHNTIILIITLTSINVRLGES